MAIKAAPLIHISDAPMTLPAEWLGDDYEYFWLDAHQATPAISIIDDAPLFSSKNGRLTKKYLNAIFILDASFPWLDDDTILAKLPGNQILYQKGLSLAKTAQAMLDFRGAFPVDLTNPTELAQNLRYYFYIGADGYRSNSVNLRASPAVAEPVRQFGRVYSEFTVNFPDEWTLMAYPDSGADQSNYIPPYFSDHINLEFKTDAQTEVKLKVNKISLETKEVFEQLEVTGADVLAGIELIGGTTGYMIQVMIYARGTGKIQIGNIHTRRSRGPFGTFMLNGKRLLNDKLHDDVAYYFDPGDMQPPLNVYFSGWRTKEGFEGNLMMRSTQGPYLLIGDQRLQGGAFYMGDARFETQLLQVIQDKLAQLNFDPHDVILSGMSMGTYGALYYGAQLNPKGIVVGKPLTNIGDIAQNGRVKRPDDFNTVEDMQLYFENSLSDAASERLNERFWRVFNQGDFHNTTLALAYMEQDDYDDQAFYRIRDNIKARFPKTRLLSKGFEGRHNDNTADVVNWFQFHLRQLLAEYGRKL